MRRQCTAAVRGRDLVDGAGVRVHRVLGPDTVEDFDPFLMLDGFDSDDPSDYIKGFPWHPHRGIETVTYLLKGKIAHGDSLGNSGFITDGQCQWMTAGSGIIHQEMPEAEERMLGCQLWVNLPKRKKMTQPAYRSILAENIPVIKDGDAEIRVLSGKFHGISGAVKGEYIPIIYLDVLLKPDATWACSGIANDETVFLYLIEGTLAAGEVLTDFAEKGCALRMTAANQNEAECDDICVKAGKEGSRFFLIAGKPLREPVAWGGPIVMNMREELDLAYRELDAGTFIRHDSPLDIQ